MIWYEWLDEAWAVLEFWIVLLNLVFELEFLDVFMGREDPIEFDIYYSFVWFVMLVAFIVCFVGVMGGIFLTLLYFGIFIYVCFDPFILIIRLNYLRDNSVISLESSYWRGGLRPRCWIKVNFWCRS